MSFSFSALFASAENALKALAPIAGPVISAAEAAAPVVEALVPSTAPVITAIEAGAASITAIAPTAINDANALITAGKQAYSDIGPQLAKLEEALAGLFHFSTVGQSVVLTPKTTAATAPVAPLT
jgi:hypothetical protein